ncbi:MAG: dipeptide/oligopeptide/nickel ABC transporter ATP-binding protein [Candidatus Margulisiibacteriota bacterium]
MLELRNITKEFKGSRALDGISLKVEEGEVLGIIGESGSGKTTLARAACRLIEVDKGEVLFEGARDIRRFRDNIQMIFQEPVSSLDPRIKIGDSLMEALIIHNKASSASHRRAVANKLTEVGLDTGLYHRYPHELSGGQCQRACIARALLTEPRLLVLDEPVSSLDLEVQKTVIDLLLDLKKKNSLTYLFITHDIALAKDFCTRIAVMKSGKLIEEGRTADLLNCPKDPYTSSLIEYSL